MIDVRVPVSVVIPCYRCSDTIGRAVDSVMQQTKLPTEVILVDDFSNDSLSTISQLKALKDKYENLCTIIILELSKNFGAGNARNVGWSKSSQPLVAFLDADDAWDVNKLEVQSRWMLENKSYVFSSHQTVFKHGSTDICQNSLTPKHVDINKFYMLFKNDVATRTVMVRSNIQQRFPRELRYAEDYYLWMSILFFGGIAAKINLTLAYTFKSNYGQVGLSSNLPAMHQGVKSVIRWLNFQKKIPYWVYLVASAYELLKYNYRIAHMFFKMRLKLESHHD